MGFVQDLKDSHTQTQLIQLATSVISLALIIRRFQKANRRVRDLRVARGEVHV
ncbi:MAG: hypothetical protein OES57_09825 [Acidimicrobiia bacterium]|nr:hypothetical protein [Acidimicrobiia bacterium]